MKGYPKEVRLSDGRTVKLRPLAKDDFDRLYGFLKALPEEGRLFLRHNVLDAALVRQWTEYLDFDRVVPLLAEDGDEIIADGTLHIEPYSWMRHVGHIRLVIAESHRGVGLGSLMARDLVNVATERGLEKLQVHVIEDDHGQIRMYESLGFEKAAVLNGVVKDQKGTNRNLAVLINDVASLSRALEDWIHDSMIPAFRVPGAGS
jgi:ribosomal protein S18 acetylase RimI-like enzyme